jgi:hypothetical protein
VHQILRIIIIHPARFAVIFPQTTKSTRLTPRFSSVILSATRWVPDEFVNRNWYLRGSSEAVPPVPFAALDYVLCAVAFFLMGIAFNSDIATLIASVGK